MNKKLIKFLTAVFLALPFISCSDISSKDSGSVSFSLSGEIVRAVADSSVSRAAAEDASYIFELSLSGGHKDSKQIVYDKDQWIELEKKADEKKDLESVTFEEIPAGTKVKASAVIYIKDGNSKYPVLSGISDEKEIKSGKNALTLKLKFNVYTCTVNFYLQKEPGSSDYELLKDSSITIESDLLDFSEEAETILNELISTLDSTPCVLNEEKSGDPVIDVEKATLTQNYYLDFDINATAELDADVKKAKVVLDSSKGAYLDVAVKSLKFKLVDEDSGEELSSYKADFALSYGGNKVDSSYYTYDSEGNFSLSTSKSLLVYGTYQLYVALLAEDYEWASATFDIDMYDTYATPTTQIALYKKEYSSSSYNYYLTDASSVKNADLSGTTSFSSIYTSRAFDADGNFYVLDDGKIYSNNSKISTSGLLIGSEGTNFYNYGRGFTIDIAQNFAYGYGTNDQTLYLFKYPDLISSGTVSGEDYGSVSPSGYYASNIAVNNNMLYVLGYYDYYETKSWQLWAYDISSELNLDSSPKYTINLDEKLPESLSYAKFNDTDYRGCYNDMYAIDGNVYLLVKPFTAWTKNNPNIYGGAVLKWTPGENSLRVLGVPAEKKIAQESITQMPLYYSHHYTPVYLDEERTTLVTMLADSTSFNTEEHSYGRADGYKFFPNVYAVSSDIDDSAFAGPARVIGIKPKKLVIADDGYAFYTDAEGNLNYKNANRVVTIDLERFVIETVQPTTAPFNSDETDLLKSAISIDTVRNEGTYYDYSTTVHYLEASFHEPQTATISAIQNELWLSVKNGDNN